MFDDRTVAFGLPWAVAPAVAALRQQGFQEVEAQDPRRLRPGEFFCEPLPEAYRQPAWVRVAAAAKPPVY